jgi:hypothetical protein
MKKSTSHVGAELSDEQVKDVLSLAEKIEKVASILNLSLRNYAYVPDESECHDI